MEITSLGHACFRIKGKNATVVCDPFDSGMVGLSLPRKLSADIVTVSHNHNDHNHVAGIEGDPIVLSDSGEYEIKGVEIQGIPSFHDTKEGAERGTNVIFKMIIDGISIAHLGDLGHTLSDKQVEQLNDVDVLLLPVGGTYTIDAHTAAEVMQQIEPHITIPMHYQRDGLAESLKANLAPVSVFLKEIGSDEVTPEEKLVIKKGSLPEEPQIVVLKS